DSQTTFIVVVTNEQGCTDTAEVTVRFGNPSCEEPYLFVPNTFTPNGDGLNDHLFVRGLFIEEMLFIVYDRWGMEVFRTLTKQEGWDGTYKGTPLSTDVFGYYLEVTCGDGRHFSKKGNVTLLRN
ncbi:MAG: gliding motility-associated C-terminal domain-containing protein, partial [Saprospiraceae bacterium]|nr:gliding motility-associated C-terminal domain-containing protein [Saprospiraceae bacterium]